MILKILVTLCSLASWLIPLNGLENELWMMRQDFVKIGKKDTYEELQKEWIQQFKTFSKEKNFFPLYVMQDFVEPEYITLVSFESYQDLEFYFQQLKNFQQSLPKEVGQKLYALKESLLNFEINTLQRALPFCSYMPQGASFKSLPYVRYFTYSIEPGNRQDFERALTQYANKLQQKQVNYGFRVWQVLFGGDVPKYLLAFFAQTESLAKEAAQLNALKLSLKEIIRDIKQSHGMMRADLSLEVSDGS